VNTARTISLRGLAKSFQGPAGPVRAVRGLDLSIERGETVALRRSGSPWVTG
jgi:ABC-type glutathione transport system ATPase component